MNRLWYGEALIVLAGILAFWPALSGGFILDDDILLSESHLVQASDGLARIWIGTESHDYWPITNSSFWFEWRLWGMNPIGYHCTNLLLHVAAALLIWGILQKLSIPGAFLAALLFTVHPVNAESVAWISQRKGLLAMVFFLLSIQWYLRAEKRRGVRGEGRGEEEEETRRSGEEQSRGAGLGAWYWLSLLAFVLAMLSKGSVAVLPVVLLLIEWWRRGRVGVGDLVRAAPYVLVAIVLTAVNLWFQTHGIQAVIRDANVGERMAGAGAMIWFYLSKALAPIDLAFIYPQWHIDTREFLWWLPLLAVAAVTIVLWRRCHSLQGIRGRTFLFAWLFFCVALAPVLGFADIAYMRYSLVADHYQHLALIGVVALAAAGWNTWRQRTRETGPTAANVTAGLMVGGLALLTWQQCWLYKDPITLYQETLKRNPACTIAQYNLGNSLADAGRLDEAIEHYQQALQLQPDDVQTQNNLGSALVRQGRIQEAIERYQRVLQIQPDNAVADVNMGIALLAADRTREAIKYLEEAIRLDANNADAHLNLGLALAKSDRLQEAIGQFEQTLRLERFQLQVYANLTSAYVQLQQPNQAIASAEKGIELAQSQGQEALAQEIESWLKSYRAEQAHAQGGAPPTQAAPTAP